jgi:choline-sulfatase
MRWAAAPSRFGGGRLTRATAILAALLRCACSAPTPDPPSDLLLIVIDTCRQSRMSLYGYRDPTTPHIDAFAAEGVVFDLAVSHAPQTLPSVASLLTSMHPPEHGVRVNGLFRLPAARLTLAELLRDAGYHTGAVVSAFPLDPRFGIEQGFSHYDADFRQSLLTPPDAVHGGFEQRADEATDKALAWLDAAPDASPWFLMVHYFDPHMPQEPPEGFRDRRDAYDGELAFTDAEIGRLLARMQVRGRLDDALVVLVADHGEVLSEEFTGHAGSLAEPAIRVPLVLHHAGRLPAGVRVEAAVGLVDVAPTVLEILGLPVPPGFRGRSLLPLLEGAADDARGVYSETLYLKLEAAEGISRFSLRTERYKYRYDEVEQDGELGVFERIVDLDLPQQERSNLLTGDATAPEYRALAERFRARVQELRARAVEPEPLPLTPDSEARLRSLGYLGE